MKKRPVIAVTSGEPAGIGPQLCAALADKTHLARIVLIGDANWLQTQIQQAGAAVPLRPWQRNAPAPDTLEVADIALAAAVRAGAPDTANAAYVLATLDYAIDGCLRGDFAAMLTCPVQKSILNDAGIAFSGHTEYLAARTASERVVMMLVGGGLRVALATTHLPLAQVAATIDRELLAQTLEILLNDLRRRFGIQRPRVLVAGLNPHAGEGGHMGREEIDCIAPLIAEFQARGEAVAGPIPADTLFTPARLQGCDAVLALYHDQGLPVLKYASFGGGVNVTLGLPIIRTSVDHGTALDLAQSGQQADSGSMLAAFDLALELALKAQEGSAT